MEEDIKILEEMKNNCLTKRDYIDEKAERKAQAIENLINKYKELEKENKILKNHIHFKICPNCKKEFESKRSDAIYCKKCSSIVNNKKFYQNISEEKKQERREKAKIKMREIRAKKKAKGE